MTPRSAPLRPGPELRRARLGRIFAESVETLLASGESYADLSVERIIRAADVSRATFYTYFDDKGDLLQAMGEDVTLELAEAGRTWFEFSSTGTRADLKRSIKPLFDTYRRHQMVLRAITETAAYNPTIRELHAALVERATTGLADHIAEQQQAGAAAPDLDVQGTAHWLVWMLERGLYQMVAPASPREAGRLLDSVTGLVWRALYAGHR